MTRMDGLENGCFVATLAVDGELVELDCKL